MTKNDKLKVLYVATFAWSEWKRYTDLANGDPWAHQGARQAHRDILEGLRYARLIEDFSLKGVLMDGEWRQHNTPLPHASKFKSRAKPVEVGPC